MLPPAALRLVSGLLLWGGLLSLPLRAQTATLNGAVRDAADGQPLAAANVVLEAGGRFAAGAATSADGLFLLPRLAPGAYRVQVSFVGYRPYADTLVLAPGEVRTLDVRLARVEGALDEVLVEADEEGGGADVTAGRQTVRPADIERVPTLDATGDLATYLATLPGVVATGDRGGQLFVRGGEPTQNLFLLDGIPLFQPFHLLGFYSAFPADLIQQADVYAGGFGGRYADYLSSVLDVAVRKGNSQRLAGAVGLSPFLTSARLEGPLVSDRYSVLASARQSVVEQTAPHLIGQDLPFVFGDFLVKLHGEPGRRHRVSLTALHTYDRGRLGETVGGAPAEVLRWQNQAVGLRWLLLPVSLPVIADLHLSVSRLLAELGPAAQPVARTSDVTDVRGALDATFPGERFQVDAGWSVDVLRTRNVLGGVYQGIEFRDDRLYRLAYYLEPEVRLGRLRARTGLRLQYYFAKDRPLFEPRLRLVWEGNVHRLSLASGLYRQEFVGLVDRRDATSAFTAWTRIPQRTDSRPDNPLAGRLPRALHALVGYRARPGAGWEVAVEGFYKRLSDLFIAEWTAFPRFSTRLQPASGRSFGFDARLEMQRGGVYALAAYGLSNTRYTAEGAALRLWYGAEKLRFRPGHDRRHQASLLLGAKVRGLDVQARWAFGSGLPFSRAAGFDGFVLVDSLVNAFTVPKSRRVIYERPYDGVLPAYHRLDVAVGRSFPVGGAEVTVQASAINLYDRRNVFYLDVYTLERVDQLPFVPSLSLEVAFR